MFVLMRPHVHVDVEQAPCVEEDICSEEPRQVHHDVVVYCSTELTIL